MKLFKTVILLVALSVVCAGCSKLDKCYDKLSDMQKEYIKACSDKDFESARAIVERMEPIYNEANEEIVAKVGKIKSSPDKFDDYLDSDLKNKKIEAAQEEHEAKIRPMCEHWQYVNDKEIYALLAKPSRESDSRIVYLYNTYEYDELPDMTDVLEVAISTDRDNLAEKLLKSGVSPNSTAIAAAVMAEKEDLVNIMLQQEPDYILEDGVAEYYREAKGQDALATILRKLLVSLPSYSEYEREQIAGLAKKFAISDLDNLIANAATADIETQIKALYDIKVPTRPALGRVMSDRYGEIPEKYTSYKEAVENYNNQCLQIINKALDSNQPQMANRALSLMKPNLEWNNLGDWEDVVTHSGNSSVFNCFNVKQNNDEVEEAKRLVQQYGTN